MPLERIFTKDDTPSKPVIQSSEENVMDCNIGTAENPRMVKISRSLTAEQRSRDIKLLKEHVDVFAWSYEELRTYDTSIIQHKVPLKPNVKPFRQKLRRINPALFPVIEKEIKKLLDAKIIVPLRYSSWVANLVPVRKKNGEIRLCVDFRNLNRSSLKDNYPLPKIEQVLQQVVGAQRISMVDGFSGYNQVAMHPDDREKIAFTTPWGTFMYDKMPFGLMNAGATFQRAMDIAFMGEKDKFVVIYLDDITVFSQSDDEHLKHLKQTFQKCRKFGLSLNPKKSHFAVQEGRLLGHLVSADGIRIDPERVQAILKISLPRSKKYVQSFIGKINFMRWFIPNFAETIKQITAMLKKDQEVRWTVEAKAAFEKIKVALTEAPVLVSPDFTKEFLTFSFASADTIAAVLLQKNKEGLKQPISFFSKTLRDSELKYSILEKTGLCTCEGSEIFQDLYSALQGDFFCSKCSSKRYSDTA